jgi:ferredoxin-NADP reductase
MTLLQQPIAMTPLPIPPIQPTGTPPARPQLVPNATLLAREDVTDSMAAFTFAVDAPLEGFKPGQYVSLGVPADGAWIQRPYSVVSLEGAADRVELFVRRVPSGALSGRLWTLPAGARVRVGQPRGLFVLDRDDRRPRLFIGTGTGLAPLLAMLEALADRGDDVPSALVHGVSYRDELAYGYRVAAWMINGLPLTYRPAVSRPSEPRNEGWRGLVGRADAAVARVLEDMPMLRGGIAYLCGNSDMIGACSTILAGAGLASGDIRAEQFHASTGAAS